MERLEITILREDNRIEYMSITESEFKDLLKSGNWYTQTMATNGVLWECRNSFGHVTALMTVGGSNV